MGGRMMIRVGEQANGGPASPVWLHELGDYRNVVRTVRYPGGDWSLTWEMDLYRGANPSALKAGRVVEAWLGGTRVWGGMMDAPDLDSGSFSASGFCRQGESGYAVGVDGKATADLAAAMYFAGNAGRKVWSIGTLETPNLWPQQLPEPTEPQTLTALADTLCALNGRRWYVDSNRLWWASMDPTTPSMVVSTDQQMGVSGAAQVTDILIGYKSTVGPFKVDWIGTPGASQRSERLVDATGLGPITAAGAALLANQVLAKSGANSVFTGSLTVTAGEVANLGGTPHCLSKVLPRRVCRINGMPDPRNGAMVTDVLIGETVWDEDAETVQITPFGAERDDLQAVVESLGMELTG